ncbi:uncharacterized protein [Pyrus communis]|uniref:uncharacterized protein n=1 Tax=Pyrus communis TaxID=23211 RepID=UPI0035C04C52
MPYFTSFKEDGDPDKHLKYYRSAMILYRNDDTLMCKIFATTLQDEAQDWFHTLLPQSIWSFDELSLVFTKEHSSYHSIKKKSDHLFNVKKNLKESFRDYVKKFKAEKAKIVGCNNSIASVAFQKGLQANHPLFGELIMKEDLTLTDSFALFKLPKQSKGDTSKLDHTRYCTFNRRLGHTTDDCYTWRNYLEKLVKEVKVDRYLDKPATYPKRNPDTDEEPLTKTIQINDIVTESEHLGATKNSKKRKIHKALLVSQVQAINTQPGPIVGFTEQDAEGVNFLHNDALELPSFLDTYSGYNQLAMHEPDKEKTAFIIERGTYYHKVMAFDLKNVRATYQQLVNMMFNKQIGVTMEVYVDDIMVKAGSSGRPIHLLGSLGSSSELCPYARKVGDLTAGILHF